MKKLFLSIVASLILSGSVMAQNVARECVLFEVFTGVNCPYCPAAALAIGKMLDEGKSVAAVAYHTSAFSIPELFTSETNSRANYYGIYSYPTAKIDGIYSPSVGGTASDQEYVDYSYNQCVAKYDQRINVTSPYTIDMMLDYVAGTECKIKVDVNKVGETTSTDVRLFVVLTESHIQRNWQGLSEVNFVTRDMIPNQNGTSLTSDSQTFEATFDMAQYPRENCEIVAWVQSYNGNKEVFQAVKLPLSSLTFQYDLDIRSVEEVVLGSCSGKMSPRVTFKNFGTETLSSVVFNVKDENGTVLSSSEWEGSVATSEEAEYVMPEFTFDATSNIIIEAVELNGNSDGYHADNIYNVEVAEPINVEDGYLKLQLKTGSDAENLSIEIKNMDSGEILHTYTYTQNNKVFTEEIMFPEIGCYRMTIRNSAGNGFGGGFWGLKNSSNTTVMSGTAHDNTFRYELSFEISCNNVDVNEVSENNIEIYPNPASSFINVTANNMTKVCVFNTVGQLLYEENVSAEVVKVATDSWTNGLYYVKVETADGKATSQKVIVNK